MLRRLLLAAAGNDQLRGLAETSPVSRTVVDRYLAGDTATEAVQVAARLVGDGLTVTLDHLGEDTTDHAAAVAATAEVVGALGQVADAGLTGSVEVSVKLSALGQALPQDGEAVALEHARQICATARNVGTTVTLDMEDHTTTDSTLRVLRSLREDYPDVGVAIQACLRRSEADCQALAAEGARVRLCKGAYAEPPDVAYSERGGVDRSYVRCAKVLMSGSGYPMIATHDARLIEIAAALAARARRSQQGWEYQMLHGVRPAEQRRLAAVGHRVRIYLPYGHDWYPYMVRRMAERPANLALFLRSLVPERSA